MVKKYLLVAVFGMCAMGLQVFASIDTILPADTLITCASAELPANHFLNLPPGTPGGLRCHGHFNATVRMPNACRGFSTWWVEFSLYGSEEPFFLRSPVSFQADGSGFVELSINTAALGNAVIRDNGIPLNGGCFGDTSRAYHKITWTFVNNCAETITLSQHIRLLDCRSPQLAIRDFLNMSIPDTGGLTLSGADFDIGSFDDCTADTSLVFSFSNDTLLETMHIPCAGAETPRSMYVDIWVGDEGYDANCDGITDWSERNTDSSRALVILDRRGCPDTGPCTNGTITTSSGVPVGGVSVTMRDRSGTEILTRMTDNDGCVDNALVLPPVELYFAPFKDDEVYDAISTLDLIRLQKHLLGIEQITDPFQLIAGDANGNRDLSALDILELRKLILRIYDRLPNTLAWRFVPASHEFADPANPWFFPSTTSRTDPDMIAVKVGDINGSYRGSGDTGVQTIEGSTSLTLTTTGQSYRTGEVVSVPVLAANEGAILGLQTTVSHGGLRLIGVDPGVLPVGDGHFAGESGMLALSWSDGTSRILVRNETLFTLHFEALKDGDLEGAVSFNSAITRSEAYDQEERAIDIDFVVGKDDESVQSPHDLECVPNPFTEQVAINFELEIGCNVQIRVFDATGRCVSHYEQVLPAGRHSHLLSAGELGISGVYHVFLETPDRVSSHRVVLAGQ